MSANPSTQNTTPTCSARSHLSSVDRKLEESQKIWATYLHNIHSKKFERDYFVEQSKRASHVRILDISYNAECEVQTYDKDDELLEELSRELSDEVLLRIIELEELNITDDDLKQSFPVLRLSASAVKVISTELNIDPLMLLWSEPQPPFLRDQVVGIRDYCDVITEGGRDISALIAQTIPKTTLLESRYLYTLDSSFKPPLLENDLQHGVPYRFFFTIKKSTAVVLIRASTHYPEYTVDTLAKLSLEGFKCLDMAMALHQWSRIIEDYSRDEEGVLFLKDEWVRLNRRFGTIIQKHELLEKQMANAHTMVSARVSLQDVKNMNRLAYLGAFVLPIGLVNGFFGMNLDSINDSRLPLCVDGYTLTVTAGPSRDTATHAVVPVNTERPVVIETEMIKAEAYVRVQGFRNSSCLPSTSPYFAHQPHTADKYSISLSPLTFTSKAGPISGDDLVLANDFDKPIAQSLPPGFSVAWRAARWVTDPGLDGDPWAEKPWMEGRVLSSVNVIDVGDRKTATAADTSTSDNTANGGEKAKGDSTDSHVDVLTEGLYKIPLDRHISDDKDDGSADQQTSNTDAEIPHTAPARMKFFVAAENRRRFMFQPDTKYWLDFFNPYLDFNDFALRLPGISIPILQYWDGQPLRYLLKNRADQTVYLVIQFALTSIDNETTSDDDDDRSEESEGDDEEQESAGSGVRPQGGNDNNEQAQQDDVD
ncbi:hypothetical protein Dda_3100 [Drechslerella dactyloides]|uniref:Domain of unknown function at the cortex 1 domain-containing protein n=1 Tax=Drechslerella dactyloides TaxID=74499 RepID=A0AAD6J0U3_DREDA|nr:hypothetical protein Dda_3100 [Drechslerella dactyloides]